MSSNMGEDRYLTVKSVLVYQKSELSRVSKFFLNESSFCILISEPF